MATTSNDIANQALQYVGMNNVPPVSGQAPTFDNSAAGLALQKLYAPCVATVARQFGWDFARRVAALVPTGNLGQLGFTTEYLYPGNGIEVWELMPGVIADPNNPLPTTWDTGNALVSGVQTKVIWTSELAPVAIYNNNPNESTWDAGFREAVVRLLGSELASAIAGKPDTSAALLQSAAGFESAGQSRNG